jgi:NAD(P)-dependent dehydrogenase (short-subunit alcohol dehydrogenase family)
MKIAMVTGPSSGIGLATAIEMAARGYHVVAAGRSEERTTKVVDQINDGIGSAEYLHLDLASLRSCEQAARAFLDSDRHLDVLIDNAGVGGVRGITEDGFEIAFGVNHLGHFMLTNGLRPAFRHGSRVVVVSSEVHRRADGIDFDEVRTKTGLLGGWAEYGVSKLANILFARHLARLAPELRTYSLHPGVADTNIFPALVKPFFRNRRPPHEAAQTSVYCATSDQVADQSGRYYSRMSLREPSVVAQDDGLAAELWARSAQWCGIGATDESH